MIQVIISGTEEDTHENVETAVRDSQLRQSHRALKRVLLKMLKPL